MIEKRSPGRPLVNGLTPSQETVLNEIQRLISAKHIPPTMVELALSLGMTAASAHESVNQLVRKGYVEREARKARSLRVVRGSEHVASELLQIPILGNVAAGCPIFAEENVSGHICVDSGTFGKGKFFALKVVGQSMKDAKIPDGCLVIVKHQVIADNRDIVVAWLGGAVTVKRLSVFDGEIQLLPENKRFKPIDVQADSDFRILGKVVGIRTLG